MDSLPSQLTEPIIIQNHRAAVEAYLADTRLQPLLLLGDAHVILEQFPKSSIDVVMTSPPYWGNATMPTAALAWSLIITATLSISCRYVCSSSVS
jgi:hypothetical protein